MACTEGMGIAASRSSVDDCMGCPKLARIAEDVAAQKRIHARMSRPDAK